MGYSVSSTGKLFLVSPLVVGENLDDVVFSQSSAIKIQDDATTVMVLHQIAVAISFLHTKNIIHQDLKPANVLVEAGTLKVVVVDFGVSTFSRSTVTKCGGANAGTLVYQHREALEGLTPTAAVDVYAYGCIFYEASTKVRVWADLASINALALMGKISNGEFPTMRDDMLFCGCKAIVEGCFKPAQERISMSDILAILDAQQ